MDGKKDEEIDDNVLLIACYEKPYPEASLEMIRGKIRKERPTKIIILKIIEEPKIKDTLDTRLGKKTSEEFKESVIEDKKKKVDDYAEDILEITKETGIPTEVRIRKTEIIADEIVENYEKMDIDHIILHEDDKALLDRLARGNVEKKVEEHVEDEDITKVE